MTMITGLDKADVGSRNDSIAKLRAQVMLSQGTSQVTYDLRWFQGSYRRLGEDQVRRCILTSSIAGNKSLGRSSAMVRIFKA